MQIPKTRGVGMIFFMGGGGGGGGANSFFLALRATSVIFWRYTPKPEFQKKFALLTEIFKNYLIRF